MKNLSTKKLILTALFMALTTLSTMSIRIPLPLGYVNLGDAFVLLSVFVLGPLYGTISAGFGSGLADLFVFIEYAPGTLIIKSLMAILAFIVYKLTSRIIKYSIVSEICAGIVATIVMAFGYFLYEILIFSHEGVGVAIVNVPWNLLQGAVGTIVAVSIMRIIKATKLIEKLNL